MADSKLTALTELTTVADEDVLYIVDDPAGTPTSKKITKANLTSGLGGVTVATKSTTFTADTSDYIYYCTVTADYTATLPAASGNSGLQLTFIKKYGDSTLTIDGNGSETINGQTTFLIEANGFVKLLCDGTEWHVLEHSPHLEPGNLKDSSGNWLTTSSFTWINQGAATAADYNGGIWLAREGNDGNWNMKILKRTAPSTPYYVVARVESHHREITYNMQGLCFRESGTSKLQAFNIIQNGNNVPPYLAVENMNSPTSWSSTASARRGYYFGNRQRWLRLGDDGTDLTFDYSSDGYHWNNVYTVARGTFFTTAPDEVGFYVNSWSTEFNRCDLRHWEELA